jgi:hypothetical protein
VTLVQIDLRRGRDPRPTPAAPAVGVVVAPADRSHTGPSSAAIFGIGLVLLLPLAEPALRSGATLALLLVSLGILGLIAALLRPGRAEVAP